MPAPTFFGEIVAKVQALRAEIADRHTLIARLSGEHAAAVNAHLADGRQMLAEFRAFWGRKP